MIAIISQKTIGPSIISIVCEMIAIVSTFSEIIAIMSPYRFSYRGTFNRNDTIIDFCIISIFAEMIAINSTFSDIMSSFHRITSAIAALLTENILSSFIYRDQIGAETFMNEYQIFVGLLM